MKHKHFWVIVIIALVLLLDQVTKYLIVSRVRMNEIIPVIPGFFNITHVHNRGAAFSLLATAPEAFRGAFFIIITVIAVAVIAFLIVKTREPLSVISFSLIAGGAVGNLIDRVRHGEVVDFIQWYVKSLYWPSFNVADSAITIGVALLAIEMVFVKKTETESSN